MPVCLPINDPNVNNPFKYCPSYPAAILFLVLFLLTTLFHTFQAWHYKKYFCWVLIMGGVWEIIAMATRVKEINDSSNKGLNNTSFVFILLAPLWINAFCYMIVGRMIHKYMPDHMVWKIKGSWVAACFVLADISSFIIQLGGAVIATGNDPQKTITGLHVYTGGVAFQEFVILAVFGLFIAFQVRLRREVAPENKKGSFWLSIVTATALLLITYRIAYRIVEYSAGSKTPLNNEIEQHETYMYVFDTAPMFIALFVFHLYHPGRALVGLHAEYPKLSKEEKARAKAEKKAAKQERRRVKQEEKLGVESSVSSAV